MLLGWCNVNAGDHFSDTEYEQDAILSKPILRPLSDRLVFGEAALAHLGIGLL